MKLSILKQSLHFLLIAGLCLASYPHTAQGNIAKDDTTSSLQAQIITRVSDSSNGSLEHYTYRDTTGKEYILDTANTGDTDNAFSNPTSRKQAANLPSSYDLRAQSRVTSIKNQGYSGACWAFSALKSAESNVITKGFSTPSNADFSENHLSWFSFHASERSNDPLLIDGFYPLSQSIDAAYNWGGSALLATFTLARWSGVISESKAPFVSHSSESQVAMAKKMSRSGEALRYQSSYHLQNATCYDNADQNTIKQVLISQGALSLGLYYAKDYLRTGAMGTTYYQNRLAGANAVKQANHCVAIVGWDDNYSKMNFPSDCRPTADGAWLIANSYGTEVGDNGYFWLSYSEPSICDIYSFDLESSQNYDTNYQYDGFGWGSAITETKSNLIGANIFQTKAGYNQSLKAVGIYTITDKQPYTIKIYKNVKSGKPTSGTLVSASTTSGTIAYNGFHTISLKKPVSLTAGQKFSVVVTYKPGSSGKTYLPIEGRGQSTSATQAVYNSKAGQSYFYNAKAKGWTDTSDANVNNICIKAYAKNTSKAPVISLSANKVTLGKNEPYQIRAAVKNATKKSLKYTSSKPSVAKVSTSGKITALRTGQATITIKTGAISKKLKVTVKKAPSAITASVKRKVLKKGKAYQIKTSLSKGSASHKRSYSTSKASVASVDATGKVTAKKRGKAVIRIKTYNGKATRITIQVK